MSSIAAFLVLGGATAFAAKKIGANQLKANSVKTGKIVKEAVTAGKIKNGAVTEAKIADGAVTTNKLANEAVTTAKVKNLAIGTGKIEAGAVDTGKLANEAVNTGKIANSSVTAGKLTQGERSEAFRVNETSGTVGPLPNLASTPTIVATLSLPSGGNYVVTGETEFINTDIGGPTDHYSQCVLSDDGTEIGTQFDTYAAAGLFPSGGVTVAGISNGGTITLACRSDNNTKTFAFQRQIVATRVGSVTG
jgi:hypothetical protein